MNIKCPHCGTEYEIEKKDMYRYVKCEACGDGFVAGAVERGFATTPRPSGATFTKQSLPFRQPPNKTKTVPNRFPVRAKTKDVGMGKGALACWCGLGGVAVLAVCVCIAVALKQHRTGKKNHLTAHAVQTQENNPTVDVVQNDDAPVTADAENEAIEAIAEREALKEILQKELRREDLEEYAETLWFEKPEHKGLKLYDKESAERAAIAMLTSKGGVLEGVNRGWDQQLDFERQENFDAAMKRDGSYEDKIQKFADDNGISVEEARWMLLSDEQAEEIRGKISAGEEVDDDLMQRFNEYAQTYGGVVNAEEDDNPFEEKSFDEIEKEANAKFEATLTPEEEVSAADKSEANDYRRARAAFKKEKHTAAEEKAFEEETNKQYGKKTKKLAAQLDAQDKKAKRERNKGK